MIEQPDDFCPDCFAALLAWHCERRATAVPPPARPKAKPIDRDALVSSAADLLKAQVHQSIGTARDQPTAILIAGELPPELFAGISVRAEAMADTAIAAIAGKPRTRKLKVAA